MHDSKALARERAAEAGLTSGLACCLQDRSQRTCDDVTMLANESEFMRYKETEQQTVFRNRVQTALVSIAYWSWLSLYVHLPHIFYDYLLRCCFFVFCLWNMISYKRDIYYLFDSNLFTIKKKKMKIWFMFSIFDIWDRAREADILFI